MVARILILSSFFDIPTTISSEVTFRFDDWARRQGHHVTTLWSWGATRIPLTLAMLSKYDMVVYSGHGLEDEWVGNELIIGLIKAGDNSDVLKGLIAVGCPVCLSAKVLGPDAINKGCYTFVGSTDYVWVAFTEPEYDYKADFVNTWLELLKDIASDVSVGNAVIEYQRKCYELADYYDYARPNDNYDWYSNKLRKNADYMTVLGNLDIRLRDVARA